MNGSYLKHGMIMLVILLINQFSYFQKLSIIMEKAIAAGKQTKESTKDSETWLLEMKKQ